MVYVPNTWQEHEEQNGKVLQEGSTITAQKMNNIEKGLGDAHQHIGDDNTHLTPDEKKKLGVLAMYDVTTATIGAVHPLLYALRIGKQRYLDEEFITGTNGVLVYNNTKNSTGVVITRVPMADAPNASKQVLEIRHNGVPTSPNLGGFVQNNQAEINAIFVQMFWAKVPVGYTLQLHTNSMGTGFADRWLTPNKGTRKWELYARMVVCGAEGTFSVGGHVSLKGTPAPTAKQNVVWHVASCTQFKLTETDRTAKWHTPTLMNGWIANSTETAPAYYKDSLGRVYVVGRMKEGHGPIAFYLPEGYRPKRVMSFSILSEPKNQVGRVEVKPTGAVRVVGYSGATSVSLDGISFLAEQ